jgi:type I restriction enzyme S subunit
MAKYQTVCLGDVTDLITKGTTPTTLGFSFQDEGINFVKIESITEIGTFLQEKFEHISNDCNEKLKRSQLKENDILFSIAGAIGRTAFVTKDILPANTNQALAIIRLDDDRLLHEYVIYALKSDLIYKQFEKQKQGVAQLNISLKDVSDFIIPLPPLETQRQIAANLDKVTHTIDLCNAILEKLDMLVKSRFVEMFGEPIDNPMGWEVKPLKELSTLITNGNTPKGGSENYVESGITFLRSQNVWRNRIDLSDVAYIDEETHQKMKKSIVNHNDILITKTGRINTENSSLGRAALYLGEDGSANINGHVYLVRLNSSVVPEYVVTILTGEAYRKYIRKVCVGGIDKRQINLDQVEDFPIILPPIEQQKQFADFSNKIDKSKSAVKKLLEKAETLKKALMQEYFG